MPGPIVAAKARIVGLIARGKRLKATARESGWKSNRAHGEDFLVDDGEHSSWSTSCRQVLERLCGNSSHYLTSFNVHTKGACVHNVNTAIGVLEAVVDDIDNGQLGDLPRLVRAEVFADFLEQAEFLLREGFHVPAAVLAGGVLEDALRKLCAKHGIAVPDKPKLDAMNADLAKAGEYEKLGQKQVTAWADLRNKAAHGQPDKFTDEDVRLMLAGVRDFVAKRMT